MEKQPLDLQEQDQTRASWLLLIGVLLVASNLRVPITSVGTLLAFIREDLGISNTSAGMITTLPLLAFALLSPFAPKIANRIGMEWTIALSLALLFIGIIVRSLMGVVFLFTGTILLGLAIAISNVLIPGIIKMNFPFKVGLMTGLYAVFMNIFGALGSGLSAPIASIGGIGWQGALAVWGLFTLITLFVWIPQLKRRKQRETIQADTETEHKTSLWRSPLAWSITFFMGGQSLGFYTMITWMPDILSNVGFNANTAGWMVFIMQFALVPTNFLTPIIAERFKNQSVLGIITGMSFVIGFIGLMMGQAWFVPISAILFGIASGMGFSLSMMLFTMRTRDGFEAAELSGMAQSFGYLLAAAGPVFVGVLHDITSGWILPLLFMVLIAVIVLIAGGIAGREGLVLEKKKSANG